MRLQEFDYELSAGRIAQRPPPERDAARMLRLDRATGELADLAFRDLAERLQPGDLLVANDSRVFPARLLGRRVGVHAQPVPSPRNRAARDFLAGEVEALLTGEVEPGVWEALVRPGRKLGVGERLEFGPGLDAEVIGRGELGLRRLRFADPQQAAARIEKYGHVPLPPYIRRADEPEDRERYQTVFAAQTGSAAAPTAGLHFTRQVLQRLAARGVELATVTLHVGLGTFQPVHAEEIESHAMHAERFVVSADTVAAVARARAAGGRIIAGGTTAARALESAATASPGGALAAAQGETRLFLYPGGPPFRVIDGLLTNFHAPRSSLLMMVAAFAGVENIRRAYAHALAAEYRFLSYGDCMLIL